MDDKSPYVTRPEGREGGLSATWHNVLTAAGVVICALAVVEADWMLLLFGIPAIAFGSWTAMRRLSSGISGRGLAWVAVQAVVVAAGIGLIVLLKLEGVGMWIAVAVIVLASPVIATRLTGVRELP
jgi:hypothetical protein